jgi:DNA-directed RNA polymerase subunit M/transcription elongation factor TFIIS
VSSKKSSYKGVKKRKKQIELNLSFAAEAWIAFEDANLLPLEEYIDTNQKWKSKCLLCGTVVSPRIADVKGGRGGCRTCGSKKANLKRFPSQAEKASLVAQKANLEPLEAYTNAVTKWKCKCLECGEIVTPTYHNLKQGNGGCLKCGWEVTKGSLRLSENELIKRMAKKKLKLIGKVNHVTQKDGVTEVKCKCLKCNRTEIYPYKRITTGLGCWYCEKKGFDFKEPAIFYIVQHLQMDSIKVGIAGYKSSKKRLVSHKRFGWETVKIYDFKTGIKAFKLEKLIIEWLREDLKYPVHLTKELVKQGGHTETVSTEFITVLEIQKKVETLLGGYKK